MTRPAVYLHIGEPKTGTTFLQQLMWRNRQALAAAGVTLPGPRPLAHWRAAQDLRRVEQLPDDPIGPFAGAWDRLAAEALQAPRAGVISHELLAAADPEDAARAVASLAGADMHVVLTVRDMATLLPAEWQESVKHRTTRAWTDWLADVIDSEAGQPNRRRFWFWRVHDTVEILRIWSAHLPPERMHVVTVPPRGAPPELLWQRYAGVLGVDPDAVDAAADPSNRSLGVVEIELLRRVNAALPEQLRDWSYMHTVKDLVAQNALAARTGGGRLELPAERFGWAEQQAETLIAGLRSGGYHVVGDLNDLRPRPPAGNGCEPEDVTTEQLLDASVTAIVALVVDRAAAEERATAGPVAPSPPPTFKAAAIAFSERSEAMHRLRRGYWSAANAARRLRTGGHSTKEIP